MLRTLSVSAAFGAAVLAGRIGSAEDAPKSVLFLVDRSAAMEPFAEAMKAGLAKAIERLKPTQKYNVIWFGEGLPYLVHRELVPATDENKKLCLRHLKTVAFRGAAKPQAAVRQAAQVRTDRLCILTAGDFDKRTAEATLPAAKVCVVVGFAAPGKEDFKNLDEVSAFDVAAPKPADADKIADALFRELPPEPPAKPAGKPDFSLAAKDFIAECAKDYAAASAKYFGKTVELTGRVHDLHLDFSEKGQLLGQLFLEDDIFKGVRCFTAEKLPWQKATPGQTVRIKGVCTRPPWLNACEITEVSGDPCPTRTAEELAKEYAADAWDANLKRHGKWLIVSGEVIEVKRDRGGIHGVTLKSDGKTKVFCGCPGFLAEKEWVGTIKVGDKVRMLGQYISTVKTGADDWVGLCFSVPMQ